MTSTRKNGKKKKERWRTLQHNGIIFPPEYESRGFTIKVRGKTIQPTIFQEEMAYQWARKKDAIDVVTKQPYVKDGVFQSNFTKDFAEALGPEYKGLSYDEIDFTDAYRIVDMEKDRKDAMTKEERKELAAKRKELREQLKSKYGKAILDGKEVDVGNYMAEPPGIFIGRGKHPLKGRWKPRVAAKDVTLNMSRRAPRPEGDWKEVVANKEATWLASWTDHLTKKEKYVWLADTAKLKQDMDKAKYLKAEGLASEINKVLDNMVRDMSSDKPEKRNISTVCYMIYRTAMRVGDEKDPDEADTVGATTLRKEHVEVTDKAVKFNFLGKDSVRWKETIYADNPRDAKFRDNLEKIIRGKKPKDEIFDDIKSSKVNAYYSGIVEGLSAKVFRTYSATKVVNRQLADSADDAKEASPHRKLHYAKLANLVAARTCNHKRTIPKNFEESLQKRKTKRDIAKDKKLWIKSEERLKAIKKSKPKTPAQKKKKKERVKKIKEQIQRQKDRYEERMEKMDLQIELVEETKDYNLGTSLRNYIDPRVVKAWTDHTGAQWEKMYTAALQKKFLWVRNEKLDWKKMSRAYAEKDLQGTGNRGVDSTATGQTTPS